MGKQTQSTGQTKALVPVAVVQMGWMVGHHLQPLGLMRRPTAANPGAAAAPETAAHAH